MNHGVDAGDDTVNVSLFDQMLCGALELIRLPENGFGKHEDATAAAVRYWIVERQHQHLQQRKR